MEEQAIPQSHSSPQMEFNLLRDVLPPALDLTANAPHRISPPPHLDPDSHMSDVSDVSPPLARFNTSAPPNLNVASSTDHHAFVLASTSTDSNALPGSPLPLQNQVSSMVVVETQIESNPAPSSSDPSTLDLPNEISHLRAELTSLRSTIGGLRSDMDRLKHSSAANSDLVWVIQHIIQQNELQNETLTAFARELLDSK